jgi:twinkle protein
MIKWNDIQIKTSRTGSNGWIRANCPSCSQDKNRTCLAVNQNKGLAKCHRCGEVGFKDSTEKRKVEEVIITPPQNWENHTKLNDNTVKYFSSRGISQRTLQDCKITEEEYYQPMAKAKVNNIVFNYFEGKTLVNKKFRSAKKDFTQLANAKKVFYGINDIKNQTECIIVEGEFDKLAMWEAGFENCISVPNGANDLNDIFQNCEEQLKPIKKFILAVDNDVAGQKLEKALIQRLGKYKCSRIEFKYGKDANDELIKGVFKLQKAVENVIEYPVEGVYKFSDFSDELTTLYDNGEDETIKPKGFSWDQFNNMFSIFF